MRSYEAMTLVRPDLNDEGVEKLSERYKTVIEDQGGTVDSAGKWDKRKLAYQIDGHKEATYLLFTFKADPKVPQELGRLLRINDDVIRHRIFLIEDKEPKAEPKAE